MSATVGQKCEEFRFRVGARIRARRLALDLSQEDLAAKLPGSIRGHTVSRWERGVAFPEYENLLGLAKTLGMTEEELLGGVGD